MPFLRLHRFGKKKRAQKDRQAAAERVAAALARGDDRELGKARMELQAATVALLKAETVKVVRR